MHTFSRTAWISLLVAGFAFSIPTACKRGPSSAEKETMGRLAGTWEWRQPKSNKPTIVVLDLTAKGKYEEKTYQEIAGQRRLLYFNRRTTDLVPEPETSAELSKLKSNGYGAAIERGVYRITTPKSAAATARQVIVFENEKLTTAEIKEGRGLREEGLTVDAPDRITIGIRMFQRSK